MKRIICLTLIAVLLTTGLASAAQLPAELLADAAAVLKEMAEQPDAEQMQSVLQRAHGVAIFPALIKAGLGFGGRYGEGVVLRYDQAADQWYGPYFVTLKGVSWGIQVGIQSTALVLVVATEQGMNSLQEGKITLGGNISLAAGPMGRSAEASTDTALEAAMYSYSMSKGAFAGASVEGATIDNDVNANLVYWGQNLTPEEMLQKKARGKEVQELLQELDRIISKESR